MTSMLRDGKSKLARHSCLPVGQIYYLCLKTAFSLSYSHSLLTLLDYIAYELYNCNMLLPPANCLARPFFVLVLGLQRFKL